MAKSKKLNGIMMSSWLDTPLGPMLAVADEDVLYMLEFGDGKRLQRKLMRLKMLAKDSIIQGDNSLIQSIKKELGAYFAGRLQEFKTPVCLLGSVFQNAAWEALRRVPCGETRSYAEQAVAIGKPTGYRAVANANGANQLAIIVPCHRIINTNGKLGGYGGGLARKQWLLAHEKGM